MEYDAPSFVLPITMSPQIQTYFALAVVVVAITGLLWRSWAKRKNPGCGNDCGCASSELKAKIKR